MLELIQARQELIIAVAFAALAGFSLRISLTIAKQKWVSTYHTTMSYILLPLITFTITKVITGNIALSLGMIGALSIVRFRNPVKNPFELVIFFALITIGISTAANMIYGLLLTLLVNGIILGSFVFEIIAKYFGLSVYSLSFEEGNPLDILEVSSNRDIPELGKNKLLIQYVYDKSTETRHYRLASRNNNSELAILIKDLEQNDAVVQLEFRQA